MTIRKCFLVVIILLFSANFVFAGITGKITGRITEKGTGDPLPGVNVIITGTTLGSTTDLDGNYFILNVNPGVHTVQASMVGYTTVTMEKVVVISDLTTNLNFELPQATLELGEVVIVAERPMMQKDVTASRTIKTSEDMMAMPVDNIFEVVNLTAGTVGDNFRGGRATEVVYMVDGASIMDPVAGVYRGSVPSDAIEELSTETGGFSAEYGNAQSGVIQMIMKEGGDKLSGSLRYKTNDFGSSEISSDEMLKNLQFTLGGPVPFSKDILPGLGMRFFGAFEFYDTKGYFPNEDSTGYCYSGKLTYNLSEKHKLTFSGFWTDQDYTDYFHLWNQTTVEDMWYNGNSYFDDVLGWAGNGQLDTEDLNHNGVLDEGEDLNDDGSIQSEDLNHDSNLSVYNMLDHTPDRNRMTNKFTLKWTHNLSSRTFYELQLDRFYTEFASNVLENINEDFNGNGILDLEMWIPYEYLSAYMDTLSGNFNHYFDDKANPTQFYVDYNGNYHPILNYDPDYEDLNHNGQWDWIEDGGNTDLFYDNDNDGFIDNSSEDLNGNGVLDPWEDDPNWGLNYGNGNGILDYDVMPWEDLPSLPPDTKDADGFYQYSSGTVYPRARWNNYDRTRWHLKGTLFSQVNRYHQIKTGLEAEFYDIFSHDVDFASGGNVYGQNYTVKPKQLAAFIEDKMEFEGMIVKLGFRFDRFDAHYGNYPSDINDPVIEPSIGGEIKDPTDVPTKNYLSPRFSMSFPFTARDKLRFTYDKYFQMPIFVRLFTNLNFDFTGAFPLIGNPNIDPERTTLYEIGWEHLLTESIAFEAVGFYKDITGLTDVKQVYYTVADWYGLYINTDYGNVRGFELNLDKRGTWMSGSVNYTYSVAKGKSSSHRQNYETVWANNIVPTEEQYLDWDQRHTVNGNVMFRIPRGVKRFGPLQDSGINLICQYGSGCPFTFAPNAGREVVENNKRLPWTIRFDLRVDKRFEMSKTVTLLTYLQVDNIFNRQNVDDEYFQFGGNEGDTIDPAWYVQWEGGGDIDGKYDDPDVWMPGRIIRVGMALEF